MRLENEPMTSSRETGAGPADEHEQLLREVYDAMRRLGWLAPQDEVDVRAAEAELAENPVALPEALADPRAVLQRPPPAQAGESPALARPDPNVAENLARAARQAGHLPPEIEQAMRRDREQADRQPPDRATEPPDDPQDR